MTIEMEMGMEMEMTKQMEIEMGMTIEMEMGKEMGRKRGRVSLRGFWHGLGSVKDLPTLTDERKGDRIFSHVSQDINMKQRPMYPSITIMPSRAKIPLTADDWLGNFFSSTSTSSSSFLLPNEPLSVGVSFRPSPRS